MITFCHTCQSLPVRSILKLLQGDRSVDDEFQWFQLPRSVTDSTETQPFLRWHNSISRLQGGVDTCTFCQVIFSHLSGSYHYHKNYRDGDERGLWLEVRVGQAFLTVYLGDMKPEVRLSGNFSYKTTPGTDFKSVQGDPRALLEDKTFKLVENSSSSEGQYIALSYCWGKALPFTTTSSNLQKHKETGGIEYNQLPQTLQDAIFLVRYLGIRYLWADCLCIVQDDKADWEREASRMADVYRNAWLTVAATRASHCGEGFLHARKGKERRIVSFADEEGSFDLYFYYDDLTMSPGTMGSIIDQSLNLRRVNFISSIARTSLWKADERQEEPLLSRVWGLQERVLAARTIHFGTYQMRWECSAQVVNEDGNMENYEVCEEICLEKIAEGLKSVKNALPAESTNRSNDSKDNGSYNRAWYVWFRLIEEYTSRDMTYPSDKLPALSGVISALQKLTGDTCLAGIWKSWFLQGLLWRLQDPDWDLYVFFPKKPQRAIPWRAPTWSFASVEGVVLYTLLENDPGREACAELLDCDVTPKGINPLGELINGFVKIRGPVATVSDISPQQSSDGRECLVHMTNGRLGEGRVHFDVNVHDSCQVLMVTPHTGVAITPVNPIEGTYIRVGAVSVYRVFRPASETSQRDSPAIIERDKSLSASHYPSWIIITLL
ncbi:hypothetical protein SLS60_011050 [Paraconiothyrium brasiliense]|uniref:Heterokaryon incompatibility domain-containing protein n=1 Tax=Paraconiothyrium brasiliense TaxID=300254 RepID=A0ABR3QL41_9PLEO